MNLLNNFPGKTAGFRSLSAGLTISSGEKLFLIFWLLLAVAIPWMVQHDASLPILASRLYFPVLVIVCAWSLFNRLRSRILSPVDLILAPMSPKMAFLLLWVREISAAHNLIIPFFLLSFCIRYQLSFVLSTGVLISGLMAVIAFHGWVLLISLKMDLKNRLTTVFQFLFIGGLAIYNLPLLADRDIVYFLIPFSGWLGVSLQFLIQGKPVLYTAGLTLYPVSALICGSLVPAVWFPYRTLPLKGK